MSLKYTDKVAISRNKELEEYREAIVAILEESKQLAMDCDNLVKMRALKTRCDKISKPRPTVTNDKLNEYKRRKYQENKEKCLSRKQEKRQKVRNIGQVDIGNFFSDIPS